jgi:rod shape-determining protein MreD
MQLLKLPLYLLAVSVLQLVVFPRLSFLGVVPDLALVSVIVYAVVAKRTQATWFAAAAGWLQDVFAAGLWLNTVLKIVIASLVNSLAEEFSGDEYALTAGLVAVGTPLCLAAEALVLFLVWQKEPVITAWLFRAAAATVYNLLLVPLVFPLIKAIAHAD